jgi:ATP-dependent helicase HepA
MAVGALVRAKNNMGIGQVVAVAAGRATVSYFSSVAHSTQVELPIGALQRVKLAPQTRCYVRLGDDELQAGRIGQYLDGEYEVKFPGQRTDYVPEFRVYARCAGPAGDPIEVLVTRAHETAFFHEHRFPFVRSLISQRAATRGLSGLASARIELYAHQVEVVRRVLEDRR